MYKLNKITFLEINDNYLSISHFVFVTEIPELSKETR